MKSKKELGKIDQGMIMKALEYVYDKAIGGIPCFDSAEELAENYLKDNSEPTEAAKSLIRWQISKAGTSGFLAGLGGLITMPVTIPTNLASVMYIQIRMIAAIAHMGGYELKDDKVKTLVYMCVAGNGAKEILKDIGIVLGQKLSIQMITNISSKTISSINQKVGFKLLTKFGKKGVVNLGKAIPVVGGVIGGTFDGVTTNALGVIAKKTFITGEIEPIEGK